jgi:hypothetical protein
MRSSHCHHQGWHGKLCVYCYLSSSETFPIHQNISKSHPCSLIDDYLFTMVTWSKHYESYHAQHLSYKLVYLCRICFHHQLHRQPQSEWSLTPKICPAQVRPTSSKQQNANSFICCHALCQQWLDLMSVLQLNSEVGMGLYDSSLDYTCRTKIWIFVLYRFSSKVNANFTL